MCFAYMDRFIFFEEFDYQLVRNHDVDLNAKQNTAQVQSLWKEITKLEGYLGKLNYKEEMYVDVRLNCN